MFTPTAVFLIADHIVPYCVHVAQDTGRFVCSLVSSHYTRQDVRSPAVSYDKGIIVIYIRRSYPKEDSV